MGKRLSFEEIKELYENENRLILDCEVREVGNKKRKRIYIKYRCLIDGYEDWMQIDSIKRGSGCKKCGRHLTGKKLKLTLEEIKERLKYININIEILSDKYTNANSKLKCKCLIDNHIWAPTWSNLSIGQGCPVCGGRILHDGNRLSILRPDLIKYFVNPKDADNYTMSSHKKVQLICPDCGKEKINMTKVSDLSKQGFSCSYCSDGISIPEKFGIYLLKQLDIEFETQKILDWCKNKRYDEYFFLNGKGVIVECHGIQHYEQSAIGRGLSEEIANDTYKMELALLNGIELDNYIVVDARYSTFEYLKENFTKSFSGHFNLSNVNWGEIWTNCQKSILLEVCEHWNNRKEYENITTIGKMFGLEKSTVRKYVKRGAELALCEYDAKEEKNKSGSKSGKMRSKTTYQYSLDNCFIKEWISSSEIERILGFCSVNISKCCRGERNSSNGFKWSYNPPINNKYPE